MIALAENARDEAVAMAKTLAHPAVEKPHLLWGLLRALRADAPAEPSLDAVRAALGAAGSSYTVPTISDGVAAALETITSRDAAVALARSLATELGVGGPAAGTPAVAVIDAGGATVVAATPPDVAPGTDTEAALLAELDALIGLAEVKATIRRLLALQRLNEERARAGLPVVNASKHLVFTGDPGTGKTTVAKIVARLYAVVGLVSKGHLVEAGRADLVAGYVGQTALKVQAVVRRAIGGVLFIDEAYALAPPGFVDFGDEAIATLVQMMEEERADLAVIVAGYNDEMRRFIDSNPGLQSRFTHYVHFPNYTAGELARIFAAIATSAGVTLSAGVEERVRRLVADAIDRPDFGNARFVRTIFEGAYANMAARAVVDGAIDTTELRDMIPDDIVDPGTGPKEDRRPIGFRPR